MMIVMAGQSWGVRKPKGKHSTRKDESDDLPWRTVLGRDGFRIQPRQKTGPASAGKPFLLLSTYSRHAIDGEEYVFGTISM